MKKLLIAAALATALATPSLAQSYAPDVGTGNIAPNASAGPGFDPDAQYAPQDRTVHHRAENRDAR